HLISMLNLFNIKVKHGLTDSVFNDILQCIGSSLSLYKLKNKLKSLVSIEPLMIDTCEDSCIAFTGKYAIL
ncbi:9299_t:CDS:1, partial [Funneliformis geosporum]